MAGFAATRLRTPLEVSAASRSSTRGGLAGFVASFLRTRVSKSETSISAVVCGVDAWAATARRTAGCGSDASCVSSSGVQLAWAAAAARAAILDCWIMRRSLRVLCVTINEAQPAPTVNAAATVPAIPNDPPAAPNSKVPLIDAARIPQVTNTQMSSCVRWHRLRSAAVNGRIAKSVVSVIAMLLSQIGPKAVSWLWADHSSGLAPGRSSAPHAPEHHAAGLARLADDPDPGVRAAVAANKSCPTETLEMLASDSTPFVRQSVSLHPELSQRLLQCLAGDQNSWIRSVVTDRDDLPEYLLERLAMCPNSDVRAGVAYNALCPPSLLAKLGADTDSGVKAGVASNPSTPQPALRHCESDPSPFVLDALQRNPSVPEGFLERCATHPDPAVRSHAARNADVDLLQDLHTDPDPAVRSSAAQNNRATSAMIARLVCDCDAHVRALAASSGAARAGCCPLLPWTPTPMCVSLLCGMPTFRWMRLPGSQRTPR